MIKRMTLLARKEGSSTSDFRAYWSGCHAELAMCMDGITSYTQNRVEKTLWQQSDRDGCFQIDGVVELCFEDAEVMATAQRSATGTRYIPEDEPNFLRGWSLCVVEHEDQPAEHTAAKVLVAAVAKDPDARETFKAALNAANATQPVPATLSFNWTQHSHKRDRLWAEPIAPTVIAALWFENVAQAHAAFDQGSEFARVLSELSSRAGVYLINALVIK